jgi:hypothetical protein
MMHDEIMTRIMDMLPAGVAAIFFFEDGSFRGALPNIEEDGEDIMDDSPYIQATIAMLINHPDMRDLRDKLVERAFGVKPPDSGGLPDLPVGL